ncbi:hypothetical protein GWI33_006461 [Rhynchophorus ferrugineus]|uniref:Fibronectin type-III domain-containing protein n=1 Tax=Rhynchophorus ferrugineus TaxID=354439 RepID=A0A834IG22_RHYFE|nr:hypothetical protein GWI33_006461 [Rhynchophorus ferrugineus]
MYILKGKEPETLASCLIDGPERYKAIVWVYPLNYPQADNYIESGTSYLPGIENDYNCKFLTVNMKECSDGWKMKNWTVDYTSLKVNEFLDDSRWDDLPSILTNQAFKDPQPKSVKSKSSFSVRSTGPVDISLCTDWDIYNFPCYHIRIGGYEINVSERMSLENDSSYTENQTITNYKSSTKIISEDEWRHFEFSFSRNRSVILVDKTTSRTLVEYTDTIFEDLSYIFLVLQSEQTGVWKISENLFLSTNKAGISRMGPRISTPSKDLCISLFVASCNECIMIFFYMKGKHRSVLKYVEPTHEKWIEIKLKQESVPLSGIQIQVETTFVNKSKLVEGWWAIDDVRVCHENEMKISYLKLRSEMEFDRQMIDNISCQGINSSNRNLTKAEYDGIKTFPHVDVVTRDTSIKLSWNQENPHNIPIYYFLSYHGIDDCNTKLSNSVRFRSMGFLSSNCSEFKINNLIPKTKYNITIFTPIYKTRLYLRIDTLESDNITIEELPNNINIQPTNTSVNISWAKPSCNTRKGSLIYNLTITSPKYNINRNIESTNNSYNFNDLRPFIIHTIQITVARNVTMLTKGYQKIQYNFTTLPGGA